MQRATASAKETVSPAARPLQSSLLRSGVLQRKCACGGTPGPSGECAECHKKKQLGLQTKLKVNEPGDSYEQEADRIADQVMAAPAHTFVNAIPPRIQRISGHSNGQMDAAPASVDRVLASPGRPLEPALRQEMGQRFGHDFASVRVHADAVDEQSARDVNANAYTVGHDIVFGAGRFAPGTHDGRRLIAHELTHVIQQTSRRTENNTGAGDGGPAAVCTTTPTIQRQMTPKSKHVHGFGHKPHALTPARSRNSKPGSATMMRHWMS